MKTRGQTVASNNESITESRRKVLILLRLLYAAWLVLGIFSLIYIPSALIAVDDAAATANNILSNQTLFRIGIGGALLTQIIYIFVALFLYRLFDSVNHNQALLMVVLALVGIPIAMLNSLNQIAALFVISGDGYLSTFTIDQLRSLMMLFLDLYKHGNLIASIFWGLWLLPLGYLIYKSGYFPKPVGFGVVVGGLGYLALVSTSLVVPEAKTLISVCEAMTFGEVIFVGWIIIMGAKFPD